MTYSAPTFSGLWHGLGWPVIKLIFNISLGLMAANFIEAMNLTRLFAKLAVPLTRIGNLSDTTGASFSMAFFSGLSSNTMLSEAYDQGRISRKELVLANLFNSLPTYFLHLPTVFFLTAPLIKMAAFIYVGLTLFAAFLRTVAVVAAGRILLPPRLSSSVINISSVTGRRLTVREAADKAWLRFRKRIRKILTYTLPVYIMIYFLNKAGLFVNMESYMTSHLKLLSWLDPRGIGIVVAHVAAEFSAGLAVAGSLLQSGTLEYRQVVLALLVGNVLASPVRTIRHQFPYYSGIFNPALATELIFFSQFFRIMSIIAVGSIYYLATA